MLYRVVSFSEIYGAVSHLTFTVPKFQGWYPVIWTGQDYATGNSSRRETKRQTEETMGRQRVNWP